MQELNLMVTQGLQERVNQLQVELQRKENDH